MIIFCCCCCWCLMLIDSVALFCCWSTVVHCFYVDCWSTGLHCFDVVPARLVGGCCWTTLAACAPFFSETVATSPPPRSHTPSALLRPKKNHPVHPGQKCCEVAPLRQLIKKLNHACINNQIRSKQKLRFYIICKSEEDYRLVLQCDVQPLQVALKIFWGFLAGEPQVFPNWHLYILCSTQT